MKSTNFVIPLHVYPFDILFSLGQTDKQFVTTLKKYDIEWTDDMRIDDCLGKYKMLGEKQSLIRLKTYPETTKDFGLLQHEILHAVIAILQCVGMKLSDDSEESYTYLTQYITEQAYEKIFK